MIYSIWKYNLQHSNFDMNDLQIFMDVILCKLLDALIMVLSCNGSSWRFWSNFVFLVVCFVLLKNLHTAQISKSGYHTRDLQ